MSDFETLQADLDAWLDAYAVEHPGADHRDLLADYQEARRRIVAAHGWSDDAYCRAVYERHHARRTFPTA